MASVHIESEAESPPENVWTVQRENKSLAESGNGTALQQPSSL
jgi:hypothetical protein